MNARTVRGWWVRLVLLGTLVAFLAPALAGSLGSLCICLGGDGPPIAAGACCCGEPPAGDPCGDPAAPAPHADPCDAPSRDDCVCIDLRSADEPPAPDRPAPADLPAPVDALPVAAAAPPSFATCGAATLPVRPPPLALAPPARRRVLRL